MLLNRLSFVLDLSWDIPTMFGVPGKVVTPLVSTKACSDVRYGTEQHAAFNVDTGLWIIP